MPATTLREGDESLCISDVISIGCRGIGSILKFVVDNTVLYGHHTVYMQTNKLNRNGACIWWSINERASVPSCSDSSSHGDPRRYNRPPAFLWT